MDDRNGAGNNLSRYNIIVFHMVYDLLQRNGDTETGITFTTCNVNSIYEIIWFNIFNCSLHCFFCNLFYCYHFTFTWIFPIEKKTSPFETIANSKLNGFSICQNQNIAFEWIHAWQITCESYSFVILKQTYRCWGEGGSTRIFCSHTKWK